MPMNYTKAAIENKLNDNRWSSPSTPQKPKTKVKGGNSPARTNNTQSPTPQKRNNTQFQESKERRRY